MDQDNQGNNHDASDNNPMRRGRGRPRKHPRSNANRWVAIRGDGGDENFNRQENVPLPPGFGGVDGNQPPHQVNLNVNANDLVVGQVIQGVVESSFEAGYLISVRLDNSENTLRGAIFKPGHYVPVAAHNDVAPNLPMIRRHEVPLPAVNLNQAHGHNPRSRKRNGTTANSGPSRVRHVPLVSVQTVNPVPSDKVVPVVLQPANLSKGVTIANQPPVLTPLSPLEASKGKQVQEAAYPSNGSKHTNPMQTVGNQVLPSPPTSNPGMPKQASVEVLHNKEAFSIKIPMPCEILHPEVIRRSQTPSISDELQMKIRRDENNDMDQPLNIEPLQTIMPGRNVQSASLPKPFENFRTGKMTELLRAVQENMMENQSPQTEEPTRGSRPGADAEEQGDKENGHLQAPRV